MASTGRRKSPWWAILLTGAVVILAATFAFLAVSSVFQSKQALRTVSAVSKNDTQLRAAASARITSLGSQVSTLEDHIRADGNQLGKLTVANSALLAQLKTLGVAPVVTVSPIPVRAAAPTSPPRSSSPSAKPAPTRPAPSGLNAPLHTAAPSPAAPSPVVTTSVPAPEVAPPPSPTVSPSRSSLCLVVVCVRTAP